VRPRARTLVVALALATLATVVTAAPAQAAEVKGQTHLVAQFDSGHTGWIKIALERLDGIYARAHLAVWCQNASGTKVQCRRWELAPYGALSVQWWNEGTGWSYTASTWYGPWIQYLPPVPHNKYTEWRCTDQGTDQYRALIKDIRIQDAFGQWSGWKTRTHETWLGAYC
jgi:hypothetical protein